MSVPAAYLGVILIWSTTPLGIKWSGEGVGFLFGVTARMALGAVLCLLLVRLLRVEMPWHRAARRTYAAAGLGIYGAMISVYWAAQYIPSGLVSVLFGLTPLVTGVMASVWLGERLLTPAKVGGIAVGLLGLAVIFDAGRHLPGSPWQGIAAMLLSVVLHSASTVWVKRIGVSLHPMAVNAGGLSLAVVLYLATWALFDGALPAHIGPRAGGSILYLALVGTVVGFNLYYYALRHLSAGVMGLIALMTPVLALLFGQWLNGEAIPLRVWEGTACILCGLLFFQWGGRLGRVLRRNGAQPGQTM